MVHGVPVHGSRYFDGHLTPGNFCLACNTTSTVVDNFFDDDDDDALDNFG